MKRSLVETVANYTRSKKPKSKSKIRRLRSKIQDSKKKNKFKIK